MLQKVGQRHVGGKQRQPPKEYEDMNNERVRLLKSLDGEGETRESSVRACQPGEAVGGWKSKPPETWRASLDSRTFTSV